MKTVKINSMRLKNFKGIRELTVNFDDEITFINGGNATGKTTIFDAFTWLLFGKDSEGKSKFDIKTLDKNNKPINRLEHEVEGTLMVEGRLLRLRKVYKEIWTKRNGDEFETFTGKHETNCFFDEIPVLVGEYERRINDIIEENTFRLITDPLSFNRKGMAEKRLDLIKIAGEITPQMIISTRPDLADVEKILNGYSIADEKKKLASEKKKLKDELEKIPERIDEANSLMPEAKNWESIEKEITGKENEIEKLQQSIVNLTSQATEIIQRRQKRMNRIAEIDRQIFSLKNTAESQTMKANSELEVELYGLKNQMYRLEGASESLLENSSRKKEQIQSIESISEDLRGRWMEMNATEMDTINPDDLSCPTCKREYPDDKIGEIKENALLHFNNHKKSTLEKINKEGVENKGRIEKLQSEIQLIANEIKSTKDQIEGLQNQIALNTQKKRAEYDPNSITTDPEYIELNKEREGILSILDKEQSNETTPETSHYENEKRKIQTEIYHLKDELTKKNVIEKNMARIEELKQREQTMAQELADLERKEFLILEFHKTTMQETERIVNEKFQLVRFRLFEAQGNGGEKEVCDAMIDGVPYESLNTAARINAGIDIINTMSKYHQVSAPIFIDNREAINEIIPTQSQLVNLVVNKDTALRITPQLN